MERAERFDGAPGKVCREQVLLAEGPAGEKGRQAWSWRDSGWTDDWQEEGELDGPLVWGPGVWALFWR